LNVVFGASGSSSKKNRLKYRFNSLFWAALIKRLPATKKLK